MGHNEQGDSNKYLSVESNSGTKYSLELLNGHILRSSELSKISLSDNEKKLCIFDPGFTITASTNTNIGFIDGDKGILKYQGNNIEDILKDKDFNDVAYLLLNNQLNRDAGYAQFIEIAQNSFSVPKTVIDLVDQFPSNAHPMTMLISGIAAMSAFFPEWNPAISGEGLYNRLSSQDRLKIAYAVLSKYTTLCCLVTRKKLGMDIKQFRPNDTDFNSIPNKFMLYANIEQTPNNIEILDKLFIMHAEHGLNCSTAAMLHVSSSGVDIFSAISAATAALYGPLHGGAAEKCLQMLEKIGDISNINSFITKVKNKEERLMGFGHRIYKTTDPRARQIEKLAKQQTLKDDTSPKAAQRNNLFKLGIMLKDVAESDDYFKDRKLYPNVDYYSGLLYHTLGLPSELYTLMFAMERSVGWIAHWLGFHNSVDQKLWRPLSVTF